MSNDDIKKVRDRLNEVSPSFCLAKWLQVTIHLQTGDTHSCHHPKTHKIPLKEIETDPSALHNTKYKMNRRQEMLDGKRPVECDYCWNVEDSGTEALSDRTFKSSEDWASPNFDKVVNHPAQQPINPSYVEVSFGNECNFRCAYCAPHISSAIMTEYNKFGPYSMTEYFSPENLKKQGIYPYSKDEHNPYVEAFWKWWPDLRKDLTTFRITGGEPLLNPNTFQFLEHIKNHPMPELSFAINSNLGIPQKTYERFLSEINYIVSNKLIKNFQFFTSVDTFGKNAEFVRFGLNYDQYMKNVKKFLDTIPSIQLIFMCTYNAFSVINFDKFIKEVKDLKIKYRDSNNTPRVILDIPYLRDPSFFSCYILTPEFIPYIERDIKFLRDNLYQDDGSPIFYEFEVQKLERIRDWILSLPENQHRLGNRKIFAQFVIEHCQRKEIKFEDYCPEYVDFFNYCKSL